MLLNVVGNGVPEPWQHCCVQFCLGKGCTETTAPSYFLALYNRKDEILFFFFFGPCTVKIKALITLEGSMDSCMVCQSRSRNEILEEW